jgi:hypothetical protein
VHSCTDQCSIHGSAHAQLHVAVDGCMMATQELSGMCMVILLIHEHK